MNLQDQVTSLEISKKLKELGIEQESYFYHIKFIKDPRWHVDKLEGYLTTDVKKIYSAFTVSELGKLLPDSLYKEGADSKGRSSNIRIFYYKKWSKKGASKLLYTVRLGSMEGEICFKDRNEANARGKMLIYLLENKLI